MEILKEIEKEKERKKKDSNPFLIPHRAAHKPNPKPLANLPKHLENALITGCLGDYLAKAVLPGEVNTDITNHNHDTLSLSLSLSLW